MSRFGDVDVSVVHAGHIKYSGLGCVLTLNPYAANP